MLVPSLFLVTPAYKLDSRPNNNNQKKIIHVNNRETIRYMSIAVGTFRWDQAGLVLHTASWPTGEGKHI